MPEPLQQPPRVPAQQDLIYPSNEEFYLVDEKKFNEIFNRIESVRKHTVIAADATNGNFEIKFTDWYKTFDQLTSCAKKIMEHLKSFRLAYVNYKTVSFIEQMELNLNLSSFKLKINIETFLMKLNKFQLPLHSDTLFTSEQMEFYNKLLENKAISFNNQSDAVSQRVVKCLQKNLIDLLGEKGSIKNLFKALKYRRKSYTTKNEELSQALAIFFNDSNKNSNKINQKFKEFSAGFVQLSNDIDNAELTKDIINVVGKVNGHIKEATEILKRTTYEIRCLLQGKLWDKIIGFASTLGCYGNY